MFGHFQILSWVRVVILFTAMTDNVDDKPSVPSTSVELRPDQEPEIRKLVGVASDKNELLTKRQVALESLGDYHSRSAISCLLDNLLFDEAIVTTSHPLAGYPAAMSLRRIGSAAYPLVWERINRECSDKYLFVLAHTIFKIDGKAVALTRLEEKHKSPDATKQQIENLAKLLDLFKNTDFKDPKNWP